MVKNASPNDVQIDFTEKTVQDAVEGIVNHYTCYIQQFSSFRIQWNLLMWTLKNEIEKSGHLGVNWFQCVRFT